MGRKKKEDACDFVEEIKENMLPTQRDVVGHYYCVRNKLMSENAVFFDKRAFNDCKKSYRYSLSNLGKMLPFLKKSIET